MCKLTNGMFPETINDFFKQTIPIIMKNMLHNFLNPAHSVSE